MLLKLHRCHLVHITLVFKEMTVYIERLLSAIIFPSTTPSIFHPQLKYPTIVSSIVIIHIIISLKEVEK